MACVDTSLPYVLNVAKQLAMLEHEKMALMRDIAAVRKKIKALKLEGRMAGIKTELDHHGPSIHESFLQEHARLVVSPESSDCEA